MSGGKKSQVGPKLVFTTGEAARVCLISQQSVIRCFDRGLLEGFKIPGSRFRRIHRRSLAEFLRANGIPADALTMFDGPEPSRAEESLVEGPIRVNRLAGLVEQDEAA